MKTVRVIIAALFVISFSAVSAQEFKLAKSTGRLQIHLGKVTVEGHSGNEIIFSSTDERDEEDERAQGLRSINSLGLEDNTGLGINVTDKGDVVEVYALKKMGSEDITIKVPKGIIVAFDHESQFGGEVIFRNIENEIEISAQYNSVQLENVTGPLTVKCIYGSVDAVFGTVIKEPISIVSVYGHVDITLPQATKADLKLSTSHGEILVAPEFKLEVERTGSMMSYGGDNVTGKLNGGGIDMDLSANYGKVYVRKK